MEIFKGREASEGIAEGNLIWFGKKHQVILNEKITAIEEEVEKYRRAVQIAKREIRLLYDKAMEVMDPNTATIFEGYLMLVGDSEFAEAVEDKIKNHKCSATFAVNAVGKEFSALFSLLGDTYMKARSVDVIDVTNKLVEILAGNKEKIPELTGPSIIVAEEISPCEVLQFDQKKILAFVTMGGTEHSHFAILARGLNIPALINVHGVTKEKVENHVGIVNTGKNELIIEPLQTMVEKAREMIQAKQEKEDTLKAFRGMETCTKDGKKIALFANIGSIGEVDSAIANDAGGIGLFRTEFMYLQSASFPTEEEQFLVYKEVATRMQGKRVIIRTADLGGDKQVEYLSIPEERNPSLGNRGIRVSLAREDMFQTQIRAILRASAYGTIDIMYPFIASLDEIKKTKEIFAKVKKKLEKEKITMGVVAQGIMIETPAAAILSDIFAKEVDFFSIGTNDLTQFTLAMDRENPIFDSSYLSNQEAIFRLIQTIVQNAHNAGIKVGLCGEMGANEDLIEAWIKMGMDEISVTPTCVLKLRKRIREI